MQAGEWAGGQADLQADKQHEQFQPDLTASSRLAGPSRCSPRSIWQGWLVPHGSVTGLAFRQPEKQKENVLEPLLGSTYDMTEERIVEDQQQDYWHPGSCHI